MFAPPDVGGYDHIRSRGRQTALTGIAQDGSDEAAAPDEPHQV
jgi:hypothetical protein